MEKIKKVFVLFMMLCCCFQQAYSYEPVIPITRKGLLKAQATISPSYLFSQKQSLFYLHGNFEGFVSDRISLSGDAFYNVGNSNGNESLIRYNHGIFFGAYKHFIKKIHRSDFYLGLQPGISFTKLRIDKIENEQLGINPVISMAMGYNFFVGRYFHFFLQGRLIAGAHHYNQFINLTEMRLSAGLGFNINSIKW